MSEGERPQRWDGPFIRAALEGSLRRLRTDHVDLSQLHNPRMEAIDSDECFATLDALRAEGKIGHYGVALGPAIGWREEGLAAIRTRDVASVQTVYNLLEQDPGRDFMAAAAGKGGRAARVPTSSGRSTTPDARRPSGLATTAATVRGWLVEASRKIDRIWFLTGPRPARGGPLRFLLQPR
jgi:aryl-alcohol dehydrogenase-like predicted oxidoreductase